MYNINCYFLHLNFIRSRMFYVAYGTPYSQHFCNHTSYQVTYDNFRNSVILRKIIWDIKKNCNKWQAYLFYIQIQRFPRNISGNLIPQTIFLEAILHGYFTYATKTMTKFLSKSLNKNKRNCNLYAQSLVAKT